MGWLYEDAYLGSGDTRGADDPSWHLQGFRVFLDTHLQAWRVFKPQASSGSGHATIVKLFNLDTNSVVQTFDVSGLSWPGDSGAGWVTQALGTPIALSGGTRYALGYYIPANTPWAFKTGAPAMPSGGSVLVEAAGLSGAPASYSGRQYTTSNITNVSGMTWLSDHRCGADVFLGEEAPTGGLNDLPSWFSSEGGTNQHQEDGLPWLTKQVLDALSSSFGTVVGGLSDVANGTGTAMARLRQIAQDTAALLARVPATIATGFDQLFSWFGSAGLPEGTDTIPTSIQAIRDALDADVGVELLREQLTLSPDLADATRWRLVGTTAGAGDGEVTDQADLYLLSIVTAPPLANSRSIGTHTWFPRWGWVAPMVHGYVRERQFHDFDAVAITAGGLFMSGLLIHTGEGWEWSVDAWVLDRPE